MTQFTLPTSRRITQEWGQDFNWLNGKHYPNGFYATIGWLGHNGIDYGCPEGDEVEAVCDGVIEYVGPGNNHPLLTGGGNALLLRNDELGIRFEYLHLSQQNVYTGQRVKRGQVIARSGNTGISSGSHLHLGAIPIKPNLNNGYRGRVDPTGWLYGPSNPDYAGITAQGTTTEPTEPLSEEDDMPSVSDLLYAPIPKYDVDGNEVGTTSIAEVTAWNEANFYRQRKLTLDAIRETVLGVLTTELTNAATGGTTSLGTEASWAAWNAKRTSQGGVDAGAVADAIAKAIASKLTADTVNKEN